MLSKLSKSEKRRAAEVDVNEETDIVQKFAAYQRVDANGESSDVVIQRVFGSYIKKQKQITMYSSMRSIIICGARFLTAAINESIGKHSTHNMTGCVLWDHQWSGGKARCLHGDVMPRKENVVDLAPTSEGGMTALRDGKGVLNSNKWGRQMVRIIQENAVVCSEDAAQGKYGTFGNSSCGMLFSDSAKAISAMHNAQEVISAMFPQAKASDIIIIPVACECNYGGKQTLGRQLCKMTPFGIPGLENMDYRETEPSRAPFVKHPNVFVFQCCNYAGARRGSAKSCDFKISLPDLVYALASARTIWRDVMGNSMPLRIPLFRWTPDMQVRNTSIPEIIRCDDDDPFGTACDMERRAKKKRITREISDEESD